MRDTSFGYKSPTSGLELSFLTYYFVLFISALFTKLTDNSLNVCQFSPTFISLMICWKSPPRAEHSLSRSLSMTMAMEDKPESNPPPTPMELPLSILSTKTTTNFLIIITSSQFNTDALYSKLRLVKNTWTNMMVVNALLFSD